MNDTVFIYALLDPTTSEIRYVGKAKDPHTRLLGHLAFSSRNNRRVNWIKSLRARALLPQLEVLDEVPVSEWPMWEVAYIQFFKDEGCRLVNGTVGGDGIQDPTGEIAARISATKTGSRASEATRAKMSAQRAGRKLSDFHRERMSEVRLGHPVSSATREKIRAGLLGLRQSDETRAKKRASQQIRRAREHTERGTISTQP